MHFFTVLGFSLAVFCLSSGYLVEDDSPGKPRFHDSRVPTDVFNSVDIGRKQANFYYPASNEELHKPRRKRANDDSVETSQEPNFFDTWPADMANSTSGRSSSEENEIIPIVVNHFNTALKANATVLPQLIVRGTRLDSFFFGHDFAKTRRYIGVTFAEGYLLSNPKSASMVAIVTFIKLSSNINNIYHTRVLFQKNEKSPTTWKISAIDVCKTPLQCVDDFPEYNNN